MGVSRETRERLVAFAALLERWNARINLVSPRDLPALWPRHVSDSLQLAAELPPGTPFVDLGSGGGFPGLPLAIAAGSAVTLIESDRRKAAFLREAARSCAVEATVLACRIEQARIPPARWITARALAPVSRLLALAAPLLAPGGTCLFLKGRGSDAELTDAAAEWHMTVSTRPSRTDPDGVILRLSDIERAPEPDRAPGR
ncbi:MAG: 16S rRNA (guanine(527)-N(7))-methyltransferase RsmG [Gluconacetobacter diazotrophicus]|nr:16S rRNA (guanine(527)-N(7))-methyltransferase RsmG [Gluconacetobacter diazotrophicus]